MAIDPDRLSEIVRPYATVAGKIRALAGAGVPRADIARFLGKRYQHVRNVLEDDAQRSGYVLGRADLSGVREEPTRFASDADEPREIERRGPGVYWLRPRPDGSLPLPKELAAALGVPGGRVFAKLADGEVTLISGEAAMRRAQAILRKYVPGDVNLVDEFIEGRRAMWGEDDD
ncbi:MAG: AbrB/MazE/SpoVT family DNA-binding domain-containing protein [Caulobacterales bacterium]